MFERLRKEWLSRGNTERIGDIIGPVILIAFLMVGAAYVVYKIGAILGVIFIALLLTISLEHTVKLVMQQKVLNRNISRSLAVLLTYLLVFLVLSVSITVGLYPVISQAQKLFQTLTKYQNVLSFGGSFTISVSDIISSFVTTSGGVLSATRSIFNNVAAIFSVVILSIYLSLDWENLKAKFVGLFEEKKKEDIGNMISEMENNVGLWLRGQLTLMLVIGVLTAL